MDIVAITRQAERRTGRRVGTRVKSGKWQAVEIEYNKRGVSTVTALGPWGTLLEAGTVLMTLTAPEHF